MIKKLFNYFKYLKLNRFKLKPLQSKSSIIMVEFFDMKSFGVSGSYFAHTLSQIHDTKIILYYPTFLNFKQKIRHKFLVDWVYQIPLTEIRKDWKLKSTYFSIYDTGEFLFFKGKGFGHGVGLSQEGAMKMIDLGYDFLEVLRFYYTDVHLINIKMKEFYTID